METLSDKGISQQIPCPDKRVGCLVYHTATIFHSDDVKEFIQKLMDFGKDGRKWYKKAQLIKFIKELAGDKLI